MTLALRITDLLRAARSGIMTPMPDLIKAQTASGVTVGPLLARLPTPPNGFTPYQYGKHGEVNFTITSSAGAVAVTAP